MVVEARELVKRYGDLLALDHFDLKVNKGEIYGLLGPNGCGKTTAISCILALLQYEHGEVEIFGEKMHPKNYAVKNRIGLVMQNIGVYDQLTVEENIDYFCGLYISDKKKRKELVDKAIKFVGLEDFRKFKPQKLSGGLLRRLNLACGIAHDPDLIILDEPTVAVDPQSRNYILDGLKELSRQGRTIIYTTHYMEEVERICDRLTIMDQGRELVSGTSDELKAMSQTGESMEAEIYTLPEALEAKIKSLPRLMDFSYEPGELRLTFAKGHSHLMEMIKILREADVELINLTIKQPTLNDVFLEITGKELRDHA